MTERIRVAVAYADPALQIERWIDVAPDSTVADVLIVSEISTTLPTGFTPVAFGIFGRLVDRNHRVRDGDRIELYRPLQIDPKEARRRRASR